MATTAIHRLTLDPMGKYSNAFFSETTNMIKAKLYMNVHWMVLYNLKVFCSDMKFKKPVRAQNYRHLHFTLTMILMMYAKGGNVNMTDKLCVEIY